MASRPICDLPVAVGAITSPLSPSSKPTRSARSNSGKTISCAAITNPLSSREGRELCPAPPFARTDDDPVLCVFDERQRTSVDSNSAAQSLKPAAHDRGPPWSAGRVVLQGLGRGVVVRLVGAVGVVLAQPARPGRRPVVQVGFGWRREPGGGPVAGLAGSARTARRPGGWPVQSRRWTGRCPRRIPGAGSSAPAARCRRGAAARPGCCRAATRSRPRSARPTS